MACNPTIKKVLQVSEEAAPVVQIPIMVGNEMFVLTQQDIRRIEDIRIFSYNRLTSIGQLATPANQTDNAAFQFPTLDNLIVHNPQAASQTCLDVDHEMKKAPPRIVADIATQLDWSKQDNCTSPFPMSYSVATSTSGLRKPMKDRQDGKHCSCKTSELTTSRGCNTEPRAQATSRGCNTEPRAHKKSQACNTEPTNRRKCKNHRSNDSLSSDQEPYICEQPGTSQEQHHPSGKSKPYKMEIIVPNVHHKEQQTNSGSSKTAFDEEVDHCQFE